jgi:uncharacterized protein YgbK (DUF1537 family)
LNKLLLSFYGDDFTGSTDALEQLTLAGIRAALFIEVPTPSQLKQFSGLQAVGVAGITRALSPDAMKRELAPALKKLKALGSRHVHYKVCSTFDSSPKVGNLGCVLDVAANVFRSPFVPLLVAAPGLGRYCVFGNLFARFGIGSNGQIHRLDRHPSISKHPMTPMTEADLRLHLAKQTKRKIALFDILQVALPEKDCRTALEGVLAEKPDVVLFDAMYPNQLPRIGGLIESYAILRQPLFSIGSSGIETALAELWKQNSPGAFSTPRFISNSVKQILVGSGSCSPVTGGQIAWALKHGFAEVLLNATSIVSKRNHSHEILRATAAAVALLRKGRSVIVHTARRRAERRITAKLKHAAAHRLGSALGKVLRSIMQQTRVQRVCIAGGDTSSFAARALGIEALQMISPLTPGGPLCRVSAPNSPADGVEVVFKGGQVGPVNYFDIVERGRI